MKNQCSDCKLLTNWGLRIRDNLKTIFITLTIGFFSYSVMGATFYVDGSKTDNSGDGNSWITAKKSIEDGLTLATNPGDELLIASGAYVVGSTIEVGQRILKGGI